MINLDQQKMVEKSNLKGDIMAEKCVACGMSIDEKTKCSCEPTKCYHCCSCPPDCPCACKKKE